MCGLFGLIDCGENFSAKEKSKILSALAKESAERGTDATGIAYNKGELKIYKRPLPANKMKFKIPEDTTAVMGHVRLTTQGSAKKWENNHPFPGQVEGTTFALAHNGVLYNDTFLRKTLRLPTTMIETDSYIAVQLIEKENTLDFSSLKAMAEQVEGSFTFTVLDDRDNVYFIRGSSPLCLYHWPRLNLFLYTSTEQIMTRALWKIKVSLGKPQKIDLSCGDILRIDPRGNQAWASFCIDPFLACQRNLCSFGYWPLTASERKTAAWSYEEEYLQDLKTFAAFQGYDDSLVDTWIGDGFTYDEVEEFLYCGEV